MKWALLLIGSELLKGSHQDANTPVVAKALATRGIHLQCVEIVDDEVEHIRDALDRLAAVAEHLLVSGGLGATNDDRTRDAVAGWLQKALHADPEALEWVRESLRQRDFAWNDEMHRHALMPSSAQRIPNPIGLASGFSAIRESDGVRVSVFPGVTYELEAMLNAFVRNFEPDPRPWQEHSFVLFGIGEQMAERWLLDAELPEELAISLLPQTGPLEIGLSGHLDEAVFQTAVARARAALESHLVCENQSIPEALASTLKARKETLACAESCTGGLLSSLLTDLPGSSQFLLASLVTYSNDAKMALLGVSAQTLSEHGAVSEATVIEMAQGARARCGSDWGIAISGIAGPDGGTPEKPVGTVHLAVSSEAGSATRVLKLPKRGRLQVKRVAAFGAMALLLSTLSKRERSQ
ncbi:MAG: nicotinamide-nucleotide amidohydrolase family protein [Myxococcota bacterium]|jgi:nicotinamide-nucleotide amidase|nr:nicotinamide-nucleotide amidohydrolase family protein [Myxococcota bacterium]